MSPSPTAARAATRLGVVVPSVNTVVEPWFSAVVPADVAIHAARMLLDNDLTPEAVRRMDEEEGGRAAAQIASCRPQAVAYCCTASSIVQGLEYDRRLNEQLARRTGLPCFTAVRAILDALEAVGARRLAMASPYPEAIDRMEHALFTQAGFEIVSSARLGIADAFGLAAPSAEELDLLARGAWRDDADALLISCLNTRSHDVIQSLESGIGKPVVTSTQATLWKLLRTAGRNERLAGYGRLLADH
jgi:maleate isomerase